ncbi:MAG: dTMP kinase [Eubacteriales bacterium]|jgi:dTMP kinase
MCSKKGKLIVLDGVDSSGKETQTRLLAQTLEAEGWPVKMVSFPRYDRPYSAPVRMYLDGAFGSRPQDVNPYAASTFYAVDRFASFREEWGSWLEQGGIVLADRYTTSNAIHQGVKLDGQQRLDFFRWLYQLEFEQMGLPRPDLVLFLDMPPAMAMQLMKERRNKATGGTQKDIHERDGEYLNRCYDAACEACGFYGWRRVRSVVEGRLRSLEEIHQEIVQMVRESLGDGPSV